MRKRSGFFSFPFDNKIKKEYIRSFPVLSKEVFKTQKNAFQLLTPKDGECFVSCVELIQVAEREKLFTAWQAFDPFRFIGVPGWHLGWQDHLSLCLVKGTVDLLVLEKAFRGGETSLSNREQHIRLRQSRHILPDARIFREIYKNPDLFPETWKVGPDGDIQYIYFNGTEILSPKGIVHIACLYWYKGYLRYTFERLDHTARSNICSAVIADHPFR